MATLEQKMQYEITYSRSTLLERIDMFKKVASICPRLLDVASGSVYAYGPNSLVIYGDSGPYYLTRIMADIEEITGQTKLPITIEGSYRNIKIAIPAEEEDGTDFTVEFREYIQKKCKRIRVTETKILELCGEIDETKYDFVEYLDEE